MSCSVFWQLLKSGKEKGSDKKSTSENERGRHEERDAERGVGGGVVCVTTSQLSLVDLSENSQSATEGIKPNALLNVQ